MAPVASMFWRRLDGPGHDAAFVVPDGPGCILRGTALFMDRDGPACLSYAVTLDEAWHSLGGTVDGFIGRRRVDHHFRRDTEGWRFDGRRAAGLDHLVDLDFSFTPATNFQQLRRAAIGIGEAADLPAAWFNLDEVSLTLLPQRYERQSESRYFYRAPSLAFETVIDVAPNGFATLYPPLWEAEPAALIRALGS